MASLVHTLIIAAFVITAVNASCVKPDDKTDKDSKNATQAGTDDISKVGSGLRISIKIIYRKQNCFLCLLKSVPKINGLLIAYIRSAILLRVAHQASARLILIRKSFQFIHFIRMAQQQLVVLSRMAWAKQYVTVFKQMDVVAGTMIRFVHGEINSYSYVRYYKIKLMASYTKVSRILVTSLARWKSTPKALQVRRRSLFALMMLTQLLWAERYLYERLINYVGPSSVAKDRDQVISQVQGFFVSTKITFRFISVKHTISGTRGFRVINGSVQHVSKGSSLWKKWRSQKKGSSLHKKWKKSGGTTSMKKKGGSSLLAKWKARKSPAKKPAAKKPAAKKPAAKKRGARKGLFARWKSGKKKSRR